MHNKKNFILDFDNTFVNSNPAHIQWMNIFYGMNSIASDYVNNPSLDAVVKKYRPDLKVTYAQVYEDAFQHFLNSEMRHQAIKPFDGAVEVICALAEKYKVWFATARQKRGHPVVQSVIDKYIPGCVTGIHYVWNHIGNGNFHERPKKDFITKSLRGSNVAFVDDFPKEIIAVQNHTPSYLFDPLNLHSNNTEIKQRVKNWYELGHILL